MTIERRAKMAKKRWPTAAEWWIPKIASRLINPFWRTRKDKGTQKKKFEQGWKNFHWQGNKDNPSWEPELSQWSSTTEKKMQGKDTGTKARVFLSATFRPSNASLPVLDTSNNIDIEFDHGWRNGGEGLRRRIVSVWTIRQEPQRHGDDAHTLAGQIQFGHLRKAQSLLSLSSSSPDRLATDWSINGWAWTSTASAALQHALPRANPKTHSRNGFSPRARAEMGPAMQVIL